MGLSILLLFSTIEPPSTLGPDTFGEQANSLGEWPTGKEDLRYSGRNGPQGDQALRHRFGRMAAVLRDLALSCHVVRARSIFRGSDRNLALDGKRGPPWHRCLVRLSALALAPWVQIELLFSSNLLCSGVRSRLDCRGLRT